MPPQKKDQVGLQTASAEGSVNGTDRRKSRRKTAGQGLGGWAVPGGPGAFCVQLLGGGPSPQGRAVCAAEAAVVLKLLSLNMSGQRGPEPGSVKGGVSHRARSPPGRACHCHETGLPTLPSSVAGSAPRPQSWDLMKSVYEPSSSSVLLFYSVF